MDEIDPIKFERAKQDAEVFYKTIVKVLCPYFKEEIAFNAKGIEHIKFTRIRQARPHRDQYIRFRLLRLAMDKLTGARIMHSGRPDID